MLTQKLQHCFQRLHKNIFDEIEEKIENREHSIVHGPRHLDTVITIGTRIAKEFQQDSLLLEKVKLSSLLHDVVRPLPNTPKKREIDHAVASSNKAKELLINYDIKNKIIEEIVTAIREHGEKEHSSDTSWILHVADKIEILSPLAPLRRAVFVGEKFSKSYLSDAQSIAQYIFYFFGIIDRMSKFSFPKRFVKGIYNGNFDHNEPYLHQLASELDIDLEGFQNEWRRIEQDDDKKALLNRLASEMQGNMEYTECLGATGIAMFGIKVGSSGAINKDIDIYLELEKELDKLSEVTFSSERLSFSQNYLETLMNYLSQWSNFIKG